MGLHASESGMELRTYLDVLRRRRLLVILVTVLAAVLAGVTSYMESPVYTASAKVLLRPGDASEQLNQTAGVHYGAGESDRYVTAQLDIIESKALAEETLELLQNDEQFDDRAWKSVESGEVQNRIKASQAGSTDIISISARHPEPERASEVANAYAQAYIENRRLAAVAGLDRALAEIDTKLRELSGHIVGLNQQAQQEKAAGAAARRVQPAGSTSSVPAENAALTAGLSAATLQYESLYTQQQTLLVNRSLKKGEAELIVDAETPGSPSSPRPKRSIAFGALLGIVLGLAAAFLRDQLDDRIHSREQAEDAAKLPVLAELPLDEDSAKNSTRLPAQDQPFGPLAEAARGLRTSLVFLGVDEPLRRIVVTSAGPREGKSFVAANLAAVYAQSGLNTVIVSADLRRPRIDSMFPEATGSGPGLTEAIAAFAGAGPSVYGRAVGYGNGKAPEVAGVEAEDQARALREAVITEALRPTRIEHLFLMPAGKLPPNPAELLGSSKCKDVLDELGRLVDVVIIDAPPCLIVTDPALLAMHADGVVLVAAAKETLRGALARARGNMSNSRTRLLGVVLNKVAKTGSSTYYGMSTYTQDDWDPTNNGRRSFRRRSSPSAPSHAEADKSSANVR